MFPLAYVWSAPVWSMYALDQIQARHTYTANDIMLERRFDTMVRLHKGVLFVDYAKLNETVPIPDHIVQASS